MPGTGLVSTGASFWGPAPRKDSYADCEYLGSVLYACSATRAGVRVCEFREENNPSKKEVLHGPSVH